MLIFSAISDAAAWDSCTQHFPDVHFTSAYARVQERAGGKAMLAARSSSWGTVAQPFLMKPIPNTDLYDIKSLYGYGGPVASPGCRREVVEDFQEELAIWARKVGVVSEYCCLHPLYADEQLPLVQGENVEFTKDVVIIDLTNFKPSRRARRGVEKASERAIVIEAEHPDLFGSLYEKSMNFLGAHERWRYDASYWEAHNRISVGARWFFLLDQDALVYRRALLTIGKGKTAYAHFLGSDGERRDMGFDDLLYFKAARHLQTEGYERFHLGGGLTAGEDDPLLRFKSSFSDLRYKVGVYRRVFAPKLYEQLCVGMPKTDWFPAYRALA